MGRMSRDKGATFEREIVTRARDFGLSAQRVPLSGATSYAKGDIEIIPSFADNPWTFECKRRRELPRWLLEALGDNAGLILRADRRDAVAIIPLKTLFELLR